MHPHIKRLIAFVKYVVESCRSTFPYLFPVVAVLCLPFIINPNSIDVLKSRLTVLLTRPSYCSQIPECKLKVLQSLDDPTMVLTKFSTFDLIYVRPFFVDQMDQIVINSFNSSVVKFFISQLLRLGGKSFYNDDLFWQYWKECSHLTVAIFHSMAFSFTLSITVTKLWFFFCVALASSLTESWIHIFDILELVFRTTPHSVF